MKSSKLANLVRSSKGAFQPKGQQLKSTLERTNSISRLAPANSEAQKFSDKSPQSDETIPKVHETPSQSTTEPTKEVPPNIPLVSAESCSDHLLSQPSVLAKSFFNFRTVPNAGTDSLLRIHPDLFTLGGNEAQLKMAFSTPSPDDIVKNAQRGIKSASSSPASFRLSKSEPKPRRQKAFARELD